ncbi:MAG: hypothetical protein CSA81_08335 [Acidobacteria bacterium]|nr:MAG: hypothetical protein CSA81_08335 [Acidobacteriota bacterium]PIE89732.1 MAG: hypothetical protein CR997_09870 [Acidobacteriota bacterium]
MTEEKNGIPPIPKKPEPEPPASKSPTTETPKPEPNIPQSPVASSSNSSEAQQFFDALSLGIEFLKMDFRNLEKAANDPKMPIWVIVILAISGIASAIGTFNIPGLIFNPIFSVIVGSLFILIFWVLANPVFGGKASVFQHYNTIGLLSIVHWVNVTPLIGPVVSFFLSFYLIFVYQKMIVRLHGLTEGKAWAVVLIPVGVLLLLTAVVLILLAIGVLGFMSLAESG